MDLKSWNPWWDSGSVPQELLGRPRQAFEDLKQAFSSGRILMLKGPRRAGKTTLMHQLADWLVKERGPDNVLYVSLDDVQFLEASIQDVYLEFVRLMNSEDAVLLLDEVQEKQGWARWAKTQYDRKAARIVVSGSTKHLVSREHSKYLTGRVLEKTVYPLSFEEFLGFKGFNAPRILGREDEKRLEHYQEEFLSVGGFPEVVLSPNALRKQMLIEYSESLVARDVVPKVEGDYRKAFAVFRYLSTAVGTPVSNNSLRKALAIGTETASKYLKVFRDAFLVFSSEYYSRSAKLVGRMPKKYYVMDNGLLSAVANPGKGMLLENAVATELLKKGYKPFYWKKKGECDFVLNTSLGRVGIQATIDPSKQREANALAEAVKELSLDKTVIVTLSASDTNRGAIPFWRFALKIFTEIGEPL